MRPEGVWNHWKRQGFNSRDEQLAAAKIRPVREGKEEETGVEAGTEEEKEAEEASDKDMRKDNLETRYRDLHRAHLQLQRDYYDMERLSRGVPRSELEMQVVNLDRDLTSSREEAEGLRVSLQFEESMREAESAQHLVAVHALDKRLSAHTQVRSMGQMLIAYKRADRTLKDTVADVKKFLVDEVQHRVGIASAMQVLEEKARPLWKSLVEIVGRGAGGGGSGGGGGDQGGGGGAEGVLNQRRHNLITEVTEMARTFGGCIANVDRYCALGDDRQRQSLSRVRVLVDEVCTQLDSMTSTIAHSLLAYSDEIFPIHARLVKYFRQEKESRQCAALGPASDYEPPAGPPSSWSSSAKSKLTHVATLLFTNLDSESVRRILLKKWLAIVAFKVSPRAEDRVQFCVDCLGMEKRQGEAFTR